MCGPRLSIVFGGSRWGVHWESLLEGSLGFIRVILGFRWGSLEGSGPLEGSLDGLLEGLFGLFQESVGSPLKGSLGFIGVISGVRLGSLEGSGPLEGSLVGLLGDHLFKTSAFFRGEGSKIGKICQSLKWMVPGGSVQS
jgi:hypothetical protein